MALEHLVAALEREAEAHVAAELAAAREEAERLEAEATQRLGRLRDDALRDRRSQLQQETDQVVGARWREARQKLLLARHQLFDRILHRALELMPEVVRSERYLSGLEDELARAVSYVGDAGAIVRCSPALAPEIQPRLAGHPGWKLEQDAALAPGFQVAAADGSVTVDRTLPRRLLMDQARLRLEILRGTDGREATLG